MNTKELLVYILGYLNGLSTNSKISKEQVLKVKEIIDTFKNNQNSSINQLEENTDDDDYDENYYQDNRNDDNDKYYNENLDLDQQDPDFYC